MKKPETNHVSDPFEPTEPAVCSICRAEYLGWGNNADPYEGRCCDDCNYTHVIPARIARMHGRNRREGNC